MLNIFFILIVIVVVVYCDEEHKRTITMSDYYSVTNPPKMDFWNLVFFDDFSSPITKKDYLAIRQNATWVGSEYYLGYCDDQSRLVLEYKKESNYNKHSKVFYNVITAEIWSIMDRKDVLEKGRFKYGYVEIKTKMARGKGMHASFWLFADGKDRESFEIDMFETSAWGWRDPHLDDGNLGNTPVQHFGSNIHHFTPQYANDDRKDRGNNTFHVLPTLGQNTLSEEYHTYAVKWTPFCVVWYFNNREIRRMTNQEIFDAVGIREYIPLNIILALDYDNRHDSDSPQTAKMFVDYLRLYQMDSYIDDPMIRRDNKEIRCLDRVVSAKSYVYTTDNLPLLKKRWSIDEYGKIIGSTTENKVEVEFNGNSKTMNLKLVIYNDTVASERNIVITNKLESHLFVIDYSCKPDTKTITLTTRANIYIGGDVENKWRIYESDVDGKILSKCLEEDSGYKGHLPNLLPNKFYVIKHEVWRNGYNTKAETSRVFETKLFRSFRIVFNTSLTSGYSANAQVEQHNFEQGELTREWDLYHSDINGTIGEFIDHSSEVSPIFKGLKYQSFYLMRYIVSSSCNSDYADKIFYLFDKDSESW